MRLILFTDLDGTLLDYHDYSAAAAAPALERCRRLGVPVIPATSKALEELVPIMDSLGLAGPGIVENGAAVYVPFDHPFAAGLRQRGVEQGLPLREDGAGRVGVILGRPRTELLERLADLAARLGIQVRGLAEMPIAEVAEWTGLTEPQARQAQARAFSEPFVVTGAGETGEEGRLAVLAAFRAAAADEGGLQFTLGDRFFHLQGDHNKGDALRLVQRAASGAGGGPWRSVALGDSLNDREMLAAADEGVLVRRHDGTWAPIEDVAGLERTSAIGPAGWSEAVLARLPD
jgi:mannosyl-3-phosphoglycerate phosphatase